MTKEQFDASQQLDKERYAAIMQAKADTWAAEAEAQARGQALQRSGQKADMSTIPTLEEALAPAYDATEEALKAARIQAVLHPPDWVMTRLPSNDSLIVAARMRELNPYADEIAEMARALAEVQQK